METSPLDLRQQERDEADLVFAHSARVELEQGDLRRLMEQDWGRRFAWRLLVRCGVFQDRFDGEALWNAYRDGNRAVGLTLWEQLSTAELIDLRHQMEREAQQWWTDGRAGNPGSGAGGASPAERSTLSPGR